MPFLFLQPGYAHDRREVEPTRHSTAHGLVRSRSPGSVSNVASRLVGGEITMSRRVSRSRPPPTRRADSPVRAATTLTEIHGLRSCGRSNSEHLRVGAP